MRGLCQHTDAILVNIDKACLFVGQIGGWGAGFRKCLSLLSSQSGGSYEMSLEEHMISDCTNGRSFS